MKTPKQKSIDFIKNLLFALVAALLIKSFLIETSRVPTGSMETTIKVGDFLFVNKFIYGASSPRNIPFTDVALPYFQLPAFKTPEKGEIVVFEYPGDRDDLHSNAITNYVKRCIATPGDTIQIIDKVVFINSVEAPIPTHIQYSNPYPRPAGVSHPYIFPKGSGWNEDNYGPYAIPKKGDIIDLHIGNIEWWRTIIDREFGRRVVSKRDGKIFIDEKEVTSYEIKKDYYFMMGDNRDDSADSRFWGLVPHDLIVGEALMIYWSWDPSYSFAEIFKLVGSTRISRIAKIVR
ncbi:MAG: signal peptidase I [Melioribacteraceae bacterium]|nr:signal peptidase I [Melioribacteraceae bacterium]